MYERILIAAFGMIVYKTLGFFQYGSFVKDGHVHLIEPDPLTGPVEGEEVGPHVVNRIELVVDYFRDAVVIQGTHTKEKTTTQPPVIT